jgi:hypothetical protein
MRKFAELEIGLRPRDRGSFVVDLTYSQPDSATDVRSVQPRVIKIDRTSLRRLAFQDREYGRSLSHALFGDEQVGRMFDEARTAAEQLKAALRLRLFIGSDAPELHSIRWETLLDPHSNSPLLTSEQVIFSRLLSSIDWRPVSLRPKRALRALVAVANPIEPAGREIKEQDPIEPTGRQVHVRRLDPIDVPAEVAQAEDGLAPIQPTVLHSGGTASLDGIMSELRRGYDILYLVCHGTAIEGEPELWLERDDGQPQIVEGSDFVDRLHDLAYRPRLVVLASCRSAGAGDESSSNDQGVLASLGPRLAQGGIPAVLAMQGDVSMATLAVFLPAFLTELQDHGQVDLAVAVARAKAFAQERPDWWAPTLFLRLKSGRLWYSPDFGTGEANWDRLVSHIDNKRATPILGPALPELLVGSRREIAREWAGQYGYPMAPHNRESLTEVAQYLSIRNDTQFLRDQLIGHLQRVLRRRYPKVLGTADEEATLDDLVTTVARQRAEDPADPYRILAELELPIYVSTDPTSALQAALQQDGREPEWEIFRWTRELRKAESIYRRERDYRPTVQRPLVYHLFGRLDVDGSVPLTEDEFLQLMMAWRTERKTVPGEVLKRLTDSSLLFLGFRPDEWDFRIVHQAINDPDGRSRSRLYSHLAVQIDPEEGQILEPEGARRYLERYLRKDEVDIFWGGVDDFLRKLQEQRGMRSS